jgi:hypothetical protein
MQLDNTILYPALPAILILTGAEAVYMIKEHRHDNKDMIASICLALGALPLSLLSKGITFLFITFPFSKKII